MIKVIIVKDYEELSARAFKIVKEVLKKDNPVLGLATGSSPIGLYKNMIKDHKEANTSYKNVITFNLDEYANLPKEHSESYYSFMNTNLFNHIDINKNHIHIPNGNGDLIANAKSYDDIMFSHNIDIQVLGIGSNGHIGFNEPGTSAESTTHVVELKESTRLDNARFFEPLNQEVPTHAITMGIKNIMHADKILLLASGKNKEQAIYDMINGPINEDCPASILQTHSDVTVIVDTLAASKL